MDKINEPRKTITHAKLDELEQTAHLIRSVERYAYVRQWLSGAVLDCGCGTGYGSYMIAQNPDVWRVVGFDINRNAVEFAEKEYQDEKLCYVPSDIDGFSELVEFDWLVAVEVIEHLERPEQIAQLADRIGVKKILLTYPSKKTTHYNRFHVKDYNDEMIVGLFPNFSVYRTYDFHATHDTQIMFFERKRR